jgi:hypothetical protein
MEGPRRRGLRAGRSGQPDAGDARTRDEDDVIYALIWAPVLALGSAATFAVLALANLIGMRSLPEALEVVLSVLLNVLPPFVVGAASYFVLDRSRMTKGTTLLARVGPLCLVGAALMVLIALNWNSPGFGLVAQLFVWPLMAALGGVLGDLLAAPPWKTGGMFRGSSPQT